MSTAHPERFAVIQTLDNVKVILTYASLALLARAHGYRATVLHKGGSLCGGRRDRFAQTNHWTCAASGGIFLESAKSVLWAHRALIGSFIVINLASSLPMII
eukprot:scaffold680317_cov106-Prasinocladus_malaysianus.AAC.1